MIVSAFSFNSLELVVLADRGQLRHGHLEVVGTVLDLLESPGTVLADGSVLVEILPGPGKLQVNVSLRNAVSRNADHNLNL